MIRTQIYLTEKEHTILKILSRRTGKAKSDLIRDAIDHMIDEQEQKVLDPVSLLRQARGMWKDREDLPDFEALRSELDRIMPVKG